MGLPRWQYPACFESSLKSVLWLIRWVRFRVRLPPLAEEAVANSEIGKSSRTSGLTI